MSEANTKRPSTWTVKRIEEIFATLDDGRTLHQGWSPQCEKEPSPSEDVWGVLKTTSIQAGEFQPEHNKLLPKALVPRPQIEVKEGDILLTCAGPRVRCGIACLVRQTRKRLMMSGKMYRFRVDASAHDVRYVEAFLQTEQARQAIDKMKTGSSDSGLNLTHERFRQLLIPVAPLPEQERIVAEIEKQFTRLEAGVAALRRVQANLKRHRAAVLKAACEGRLVPTEAELQKSEDRGQKSKGKCETGAELLARILTERRAIHDRAQAAAIRKKKYKEAKSPVVQPDDELPEGWVWATWDQIGLSQNGRPFQSAEYQPTGFKLLRPGNLHVSGKVVWADDNTRCLPPQRATENPDLVVRGGELVMNLTAQSLKDEFLGRVCLTASDEECLLNQRLARLTPIIVLPEFVLHLLKAWRFRRFVDGLNSGSLIQHMFTSQLAEFTFPLPLLAEQTRIVAEVERRLSVVEELESVVSVNLQRATRLRQSILQKAFSGHLHTSDMRNE